MNIWLPILILFGGFFLCLSLGLPVCFALGGVGAIVALIFWGPQFINSIALGTYGMMVNLTIIAVPLFVFMACVLEKSGVAEDLYAAMHQWMGSLRGGLAMATVLICTIIAAMSGVNAAGIVTMGLIALPIMLKRGYDKNIAIGPVIAGGTLGSLIPPSVVSVIYGILAQVSIGKLFAGGLIPGLILAFFYVSYIGIRCYLKPSLGPPVPSEERFSTREKIYLSRGLVLPILLIVGVLGSIFAGVASPTEAASVGALGAMVCATVHRRLSWGVIKEAAQRTFVVSGMVMWIFFGATCFSSVLIATGGSELISKLLLGLELEPIYVVLLMMFSYFVLGCVVDEVTMLMLTIPIYLPILSSLGFDPVWFGILFVINMQMAVLTPPFGFGIFYLRGVAPPEVTLGDIYRSVIPFVGLQCIGLLLVLFFPQLALWLPNVIFGLK